MWCYCFAKEASQQLKLFFFCLWVRGRFGRSLLIQDYDAAPVYSSRAMLEDHSTMEVILYDPQALNSAVELHQRIQSLGSAASGFGKTV